VRLPPCWRGLTSTPLHRLRQKQIKLGAKSAPDARRKGCPQAVQHGFSFRSRSVTLPAPGIGLWGTQMTTASLIGRSGSSAFRLSTTTAVFDVAHGLALLSGLGTRALP
jgi:hypothetical protein